GVRLALLRDQQVRALRVERYLSRRRDERDELGALGQPEHGGLLPSPARRVLVAKVNERSVPADRRPSHLFVEDLAPSLRRSGVGAVERGQGDRERGVIVV